MGKRAMCLAMLLSGCGGTEITAPPSEGEILGTVRLTGEVSFEPTRIENTTDPDVCGKSHTLEDIALSEEGGLANVIVAIQNAPTRETPPKTLTLDNAACRFEPHVAVVTAGSTIEAKNSDAVLHTTHLYGPAEINISLPIQGATSSRTLESTGIYSVKCDVHGWMQAYIRVDRHPFHAVTDPDGRFRIEGVPTGTHRLEVWHEHFGSQKHTVTVEANTTSQLTISFAVQTEDERQ